MKGDSFGTLDQMHNSRYGSGPFMSIIAFFTNYFNFKGRSCRSEFWWIVLWGAVANVGLFLIAVSGIANTFDRIAEAGKFSPELVSGVIEPMIVWLVFSFAVFVPALALIVRRWRDAGVRWYWLVIVSVLAFAVGFLLRSYETLSLVVPYLSVTVIVLGVSGIRSK